MQASSRAIRAALRRIRDERGLSLRQLESAVRGANANVPIVSYATIAVFLRGAEVSDRILGAIRAFVANEEKAA